MLINAKQKFAQRTAAFLMDDNLVLTEAELTARLSVFSDEHVDLIVRESRELKRQQALGSS